tara:strand:- start:1596 stop:2357 length:762 start_codon:yes stop_codon:yes gene_type:complete
MISIIIVNYNSLNFLVKNLESINNSNLNNINTEIIIIDNNSKVKPNYNSLRKYNVKIYQINKNIGYSAGLNYGIEKCSGKFILSLNPDVYVKKNTINTLYNYYINNNVGILGSKVLNIDGSFQLSSRRRFPLLKYLAARMLKINNNYNYNDYDINKTHNVDSISGCCMFFSIDIFNKVGGFDENFFLYFEDTDFCLRIIESGKSVVYFPESEVFHFKYGSCNIKNYFYVQYQFYKSFLIFIKKYYKHYKLKIS